MQAFILRRDTDPWGRGRDHYFTGRPYPNEWTDDPSQAAFFAGTREEAQVEADDWSDYYAMKSYGYRVYVATIEV